MYYQAIDNIIPILDKLLDDKNQEVIKAACQAAISIAKLLTKEDCASWLLTMILRILHDEEEDTKLRALNTLKDLICYLAPDVCECFIVKEAMILSSESIVKVRKSVAECIPKLCKTVSSPECIEKLMIVFNSLCNDNMWGVRKACVENISEMFEGFDSLLQEKYAIPYYEILLNDKSNSVRLSANMQIGPCIYHCKVQVPEHWIASFVEMSKNSSNKGEFQSHVAYYFPAVLLKLGKSSWNFLSQAYANILNESDLKTKKCLISSVHEVGKILEMDLATEAIGGIYERMLSENVQSKILVLPFLSKILGVINQEARENFIKYIKSLHKITVNWRIRLMVAEQLEDFIDLYDKKTVLKDLFSVASTLVEDRIAKIRSVSSIALGKIVSLALSSSDSPNIIQHFHILSSKTGPQSKKQVFALACQPLISNILFLSVFGNDFQALCEEKSPNLRICCAKSIKKGHEIYQNDAFWTTLYNKFSLDYDADVRYEITGKYDTKRGIVKLRPNSDKPIELSQPIIRGVFPDNDLQEIITFSSTNHFMFEMLKTSIIPSMNGLVNEITLTSVQKNKLLISF